MLISNQNVYSPRRLKKWPRGCGEFAVGLLISAAVVKVRPQSENPDESRRSLARSCSRIAAVAKTLPRLLISAAGGWQLNLRSPPSWSPGLRDVLASFTIAAKIQRAVARGLFCKPKIETAQSRGCAAQLVLGGRHPPVTEATRGPASLGLGCPHQVWPKMSTPSVT